MPARRNGVEAGLNAKSEGRRAESGERSVSGPVPGLGLIQAEVGQCYQGW
jgi:hypothetical protein